MITRLDPTGIAATLGQSNAYYIGVGSDASTATTDAPTATGTPTGTLVIHAVNFSTANTASAGGTVTIDRTTSVITYTPLTSLAVGDAIAYDVHLKDIVGWVGEFASQAALPTTGVAVNSIAFSVDNYYQYDGATWNNIGGNYQGTEVTDVFASITFDIAASGTGGGTGTGTGTTLVANDITLSYTGTSPQSYTISTTIYTGGTAPVQLSTVDDPASTGGNYPYAAASSTATGSPGTLNRVGDTGVSYVASGSEVVGDSYVYNVTVVDANGTIDYGTVRINISSTGTGTGTGVKSINQTALSALSSSINRIDSPFSLDLTSAINNPTGTGTLSTANWVNCSATDFTFNGNTITCTKSSGGDFNFDVTVI